MSSWSFGLSTVVSRSSDQISKQPIGMIAVIVDWQMDTILISDLATKRHPKTINALARLADSSGVPLEMLSGAADIWIRDAAPVQTGDGEFVQFRYAPDYLRGFGHLITKPNLFRSLKFAQRVKRLLLTIDGGNVVGTNLRAILTDKIFGENPGQCRDRTIGKLRKALRVKTVTIIPKEPHDRIGHADGMVRFVSDDHVVLNDYRQVNPGFGRRIERLLADVGLQITRIPYVPEERIRGGIPSAVGNYLNFLHIEGLVAVPAYGLPEDSSARKALAKVLSHCRVASVPCRSLAEEGGVLNCVTWTIRQKRSSGGP